MSFMQLFKQSNLSLDKITGNVIKSPVEQLRGNKVLLNTGLKDVTTCFLTECFFLFIQKELKKKSVSKRVRDIVLPPKRSVFLNDRHISNPIRLTTRLGGKTKARLNSEHINLSHKNNNNLLSKTIYASENNSENNSALTFASASVRPLPISKKKGPLNNYFFADENATSPKPQAEYFKTGRSAEKYVFQLLETKQKKYCIVRVDTVASNSISGVTIGSSSGQLFGEPQIILPKRLHKMRRRFLIWSELSKMWKNRAKLTTNNRFLDVDSNKSTLRFQSSAFYPTAPASANVTIRGFILNSVKGGYAVGIAGNIAFLPKSLIRGRKIYRGQWRMFSILNMNPKLRNIVVKQHVHGKGAFTSTTTTSGAFAFNRRVSRTAQPVFHKRKHVIKKSSKEPKNFFVSRKTN